MKEASDAARILLGIEAEVNPSIVGFPITVITVPKHGRAKAKKYKRPILPEITVAQVDPFETQ